MELKTLAENLYYLEFCDDYYLDELLEKGVSNVFELIRFVQKKNNCKDMRFNGGNFACTTFHAVSKDGSELLARNFDYKDAPTLIIKTNPKKAYRSITVTTLNTMLYGLKWQRIENSNLKRLYMAPFVCMDGINEKGLAIAILELKAKATRQNTGKIPLITTLFVRTVLDKCKNVNEAIKVFEKYDNHASLFNDYHFHIIDEDGNDAIIEYVNNQMHVIKDKRYAMNFYFTEGGDNSKEMGRGRQCIVLDHLNKNKYSGVDECLNVLKMCQLNYRHKRGYLVKTLYSCVYDTGKKTMTLCANGNYKEKIEIKL